MYIPTLDLPLMWESLPFTDRVILYVRDCHCFFSRRKCVRFIADFSGMLQNPWVRRIVRGYISFLRGVPALVLLFLLYFGLPYQLPALTAAIICFSLTSSAFYWRNLSRIDRRSGSRAMGCSVCSGIEFF